MFGLSGRLTKRRKRRAVFFSIQVAHRTWDGALWRRMTSLIDLFLLLPLTEKVIRYLFASAEEVPHVLSLSSSSLCVRTSGTRKGSSFHNARQRTSSFILCFRRAIKTPTLRDMRIDTRFFSQASLDGHAQGSCESQICHLSVADGPRHGSSIQPHRQISCPQRPLAKRIFRISVVNGCSAALHVALLSP